MKVWNVLIARCLWRFTAFLHSGPVLDQSIFATEFCIGSAAFPDDTPCDLGSSA
jgi:hypothetical protein